MEQQWAGVYTPAVEAAKVLTVSAMNSRTRLRRSASVRRLPGRRWSATMRKTCATWVRSSVCRCRVLLPCRGWTRRSVSARMQKMPENVEVPRSDHDSAIDPEWATLTRTVSMCCCACWCTYTHKCDAICSRDLLYTPFLP